MYRPKCLILVGILAGFAMYLFIPAYAASFAENTDSSYMLDSILDALTYVTLESSVFIISPSPVIISLMADDPDDLDDVYSTGDTITILFDSDTNMPGGAEIQNKSAINDLYNFTELLGETYTGVWNATDTFVITISNTTGASPVINYTTVTPAGITPIISYDETSSPSIAESPVLSGDFGLSITNPGDLLLTINNPLSDNDDNFGKSIATTINGDIVVGMRNNDVGDINAAGSVGVFDGITGELLLLIDNPTPEAYDHFGSDVDVTPTGNILVSAPDNYHRLGKVQLFNGTSGELLLSIEENTKVSNYGDNIAVTPDGNIVIGAIFDDTGAGDTGSVYLYDGTTGELLLSIHNPTPNISGLFGYTISSTINGDLLISTGGTDEVNAVYLYNGTSGEQLLTIPNPTSSMWRPSVATTADGNLVIGDKYDEFIYLFNGTSGELLLSMESPDVYNSIHLGWDIAVTPDGNILASTEFFEQPNSYENGIGLAHLFDGVTGELLLSIESPNDMIAAEAPQTAVTNNGRLIISVPYNNEFMFFSPEPRFLGEVYVFEGMAKSSTISSTVSLTISDDSEMDSSYIIRNAGGRRF